jgi:hypothetical protein
MSGQLLKQTLGSMATLILHIENSIHGHPELLTPSPIYTVTIRLEKLDVQKKLALGTLRVRVSRSQHELHSVLIEFKRGKKRTNFYKTEGTYLPLHSTAAFYKTILEPAIK